MKLRVYTLAFDEDTGGFDDARIRAELDAYAVISYAEHFFVHDGRPHLVILAAVSDLPGPSEVRKPVNNTARHELPPEDQPLFEVLRRWRNERARRDGRPPYLIFNNTLLAAIARARPGSRTALAEVPGIGDGRIQAYAEDILQLIKEARAPDADSPAG